jgi:branched-chain amino acid transport system permease protein
MQKVFAIVVDGTIYFSWLFVVSIGLTLIYGVMRILNIAHGSFYAIGAYTAASAVGAYFAGNYPAAGSFLLLVGAGLAVGTIVGFLVERGLLRPMYGRDEIVLVLVTYAAFLVFEDLIKLIWGVDPYFAYQPYALLGRISIGGIGFAVYDLALLVLAILIGIAAWWALNRTRQGKLLLAVIHDREISTAMGINVSRMFTATFVVGATLGALGGALTAPGISVVPGIGVDVIVLAFAVSVIGGLGSIAGAAIGALLVGMARASAVHLLPEVELFVIYAVMAIVLAFRPQGLLGRVAVRKI